MALEYWERLNKAPKQYLKKIEFGALKGKSDINPQWRMMAMTDVFGPVGIGWKYEIVRDWTVTAPSGVVMVFVEVAVYVKHLEEWSAKIPGIGGSELVELAKGDLKHNDEGYKMATTDALSVAFKALGVAAEIYLGNFDGTKYRDEVKRPPAPAPAALPPEARAIAEDHAAVATLTPDLAEMQAESIRGAIDDGDVKLYRSLMDMPEADQRAVYGLLDSKYKARARELVANAAKEQS